jgi:hypothetical protein
MSDNPRPRSEAELVELLHSIDEPAPAQLHERVRAMAAERSRRGTMATRSRGGLRLRIGALATAAAATAAALALALAGPGGAGLSLGEAAAVTLRPATLAPPGESHRDRAQLNASVDGIAFPYWEDRFRWRSSGSRIDTVDGRRVRTVFYSDGHGHRVGYAIVSGEPAPGLPKGTVRWWRGTPYHLHHAGDATVVTWLRNGHLCVVAGRGVEAATLFKLASWDETGD